MVNSSKTTKPTHPVTPKGHSVKQIKMYLMRFQPKDVEHEHVNKTIFI